MVTILYEDSALVVCCKPVGVLSQADGSVESMETLLEKQCGSTIYPVHRLDMNVGGVMVYAKTRPAAANLSAQIQRGQFGKEYLAIVENTPPQQGVWEDLLWKDARAGKSYVVNRPRKGVRRARLQYAVVAAGQIENRAVTLCAICLFTGRSHQIRVQFASRGYPLVGDGKYGSRIKENLTLHSHCLYFFHPTTGEWLQFSQAMPRMEPWTRFGTMPYDADESKPSESELSEGLQNL